MFKTVLGLLRVLFYTPAYPGIIIIFWLFGLLTTTTLKIGLLIFIVIFVIGPLIFKNSISLQRRLFFLSFVYQDCNLENPDSFGLSGTRNFAVKYIDYEVNTRKEIKIGVWHILPIHLANKFSNELDIDVTQNEDLDVEGSEINITDIKLNKFAVDIKSEFNAVNEANKDAFFEKMLQYPGTIILYSHGNAGTRGREHRVHLYRVLRKLGYHIIAYDYRSFGDSDQIPPSEDGCVKDAIAVYNYIKKCTNNPVFLWGHSLGTGVSTRVLADLNTLNLYGPRGLILESPFTNIKEEIRSYPMAYIFKNLPWFNYTISNPMYDNHFRFESDQHICEFRQPVLILHAEDDLVVPFHLGYKLYRRAIQLRGSSWGPVEFHSFKSTEHYGHRNLHLAPELPNNVQTFIENYKNEIY